MIIEYINDRVGAAGNMIPVLREPLCNVGVVQEVGKGGLEDSEHLSLLMFP